ncbi:MAG: integrase arm-type DNA-binding domain-containing protein [Comamonadaceae bacterium]|nr:integrase arm-type DNA-binding domain-containing protein [Comamonadaceae bacterium]
MLTEIQCKNALCPPGKPRVRYADSGGLYLEVTPAGSKRWFWKYRYNGKEKRLALGGYPATSLKNARFARDDARKLLSTGIDPVQQRQLDKLTRHVDAEATFATVAREFHKIKAPSWSARYGERWLSLMEKDMFPALGSLPLSSITAPMLLHVLRKVEARGAHESAHTLRQWAGQVFRHGIATGRCEKNPAPDLQGALVPITVKHMAAVLEPAKAGELMQAIAMYTGQPTTRAALLLSALTFQRPGNIRQMKWADIDLQAAEWRIPSADMKRTLHGKLNGRPHIVPLARQAIQTLNELFPLTGHGTYVFPSLLTGERPMSDNTIRTALRRLGYTNDEMTAHGFRAMARTIMVEQMDVQPDVIEAQLAHGKSGPLGAAYDRADFLDKRREMMQQWADYLDKLRKGAEVIPLRA